MAVENKWRENMRMPGEDAKKVLERGLFLEARGFVAEADAYGVDYFDGSIKIMAYYERYENRSGLDIKFPGNYHFQISWIALVRDGVSTGQLEQLERILCLLDYLEQNYDKIIEYSYCDESYLLVDEYIAKKRQENPDAFPGRGITYAEARAQRKKLEEERRK